MRVLLTGAFGYLGGRIAERLRAGGAEVVLAGREPPPGARKFIQPYEVRHFDVLDSQAVTMGCGGVDAIVHLAALDEREAAAAPDQARRVSEQGTATLLRAAEQHGVKQLVFFSTFHVYGKTSSEVIHEDLPLVPTHPYAVAHWAGEEVCRVHRGNCSTTCLRVSNGYGAPLWRDVDRWSLAHNDFCRQAIVNGMIRLSSSGTQHRDFVWVEDVAQALELVLAAPSRPEDPRVLNVGGALSLSIFDLAQRVSRVAEEILGHAVPIERPEPTEQSQGVPVRYSIQRLTAAGYEPSDRIDTETRRILALLRVE